MNKFAQICEFLYQRANRMEMYNSQGVNGKIALIDNTGTLNQKDIILFYKIIMPAESYRISILKTVPIQNPHLVGKINRKDLKISSVSLFNSDDPKNFYAMVMFQTSNGHIAQIEVNHNLKITKTSINR